MKTLFCYLCILIFSVITVPGAKAQNLLDIGGITTEDYLLIMQLGTDTEKLAVIRMLGEKKIKDEEAINALIDSLKQGTQFIKRRAGTIVNDNWEIRARSAEALGEIGGPRVLEELHLALRYEHNPYAKSYIAIAIGKIGKPESIPNLARAIETSYPFGSDEIAIITCIEAIGKIGHKSGFPILLKVINGPYNSNIRKAAENALKRLQ